MFRPRVLCLCAALVLGAAVWSGAFAPSAAHASEANDDDSEHTTEHDDDDNQDDDQDDNKVEVEASHPIRFGMVAGSSDGPSTFVLSPTGTLSTTGYGIVMRGNVRAGTYKIVGPANANVLITLPTTVTLSNGTSNAILSNFTSSPSAVGTLNRRGKLTLKVGATLTVPAGQPGGQYTGPVTIFVDLQ